MFGKIFIKNIICLGNIHSKEIISNCSLWLGPRVGNIKVYVPSVRRNNFIRYITIKTDHTVRKSM